MSLTAASPITEQVYSLSLAMGSTEEDFTPADAVLLETEVERAAIPAAVPTSAVSAKLASNVLVSVESSSSSGKEDDPLKVLLVDDSHTIQKMTGMMFKRQGYCLDQVENGAEAVEKVCGGATDTLANPKYDVVFMDLQMPVMNGFEATRRIRAKEKSDQEEFSIVRHQFIIGLSANSDAQSVEDALAVGIDDFIGKPFSMPAFRTVYSRHTGKCL